MDSEFLFSLELLPSDATRKTQGVPLRHYSCNVALSMASQIMRSNTIGFRWWITNACH
jgi:hypothetical protein